MAIVALDTGSDYSTFRPDGSYGLTYVRITGARVPLECVARRWLCSPGDLPRDPSAGFNVIARLQNHGSKLQELLNYRTFLRREAKSVDFVYDAVVDIRYRADTITIAGNITLADATQHPLLLTAPQAAQLTAASFSVSFPSFNMPATA